MNIDTIKTVVVELLNTAVTRLPEDVVQALKDCRNMEEAPIPELILDTILENIRLAAEKGLPLCQDIGTHIFYAQIPRWFPMSMIEIRDAVREGVREATPLIPIRPNVVNPLTRKNTGDNTGRHLPFVYFEGTEKDYFELTVMPKGAGSENVSRMTMLTPSDGLDGIKEFVLDTLVRGGGMSCPPVVLGIGIGGSGGLAMHLAKQALLRPLNVPHPKPEIAALEKELLSELRGIGIGPMGMGGNCSVLGVKVQYADCHTASLPVAVNVQCWAARRATVRIFPDGGVEFVTHDPENITGRLQKLRVRNGRIGRVTIERLEHNETNETKGGGD